MKMQKNTISKSGKTPLRPLLVPLTDSQRANLHSSSKEHIPASTSSSSSSSSSTSSSKSRQLAIGETFKFPSMLSIRGRPRMNLVQDLDYCGWSKLPRVSKRCYAIKANPGIETKNIKLGIEQNGVLTRSMLKKDKEDKLAMLHNSTPTRGELMDQNPSPPTVTNVEQALPGMCEHSLKQISNPGTSQDAANDSWRAIESICLDLRGIDVKGDVGVLKGPVSFEDVFEVLGLDDQGEPQMDTVTEVKAIPPPEKKIQRGRRRVRESRVLEIGEPEPKRPRRGKKRSTLIDVEK